MKTMEDISLVYNTSDAKLILFKQVLHAHRLWFTVQDDNFIVAVEELELLLDWARQVFQDDAAFKPVLDDCGKAVRKFKGDVVVIYHQRSERADKKRAKNARRKAARVALKAVEAA